MTLTFPRTLQSQGHRGHVNLFGKVAASQSSEESRWKWANGGEEAGRGEFCVSVFYQEKGGFKDSLGTAGRRAGHTRLQPRCPSDLGRSAGPDCYPLGSTGQQKLATL